MSVPDDAVLAARWDNMVDAFDEPKHHVTKRYIATPAFRSLWGDIRDRRVLDAGCGTGWLTRVAAADGAQVDAVDFSPALIARAQELDDGSTAAYHVANLRELAIFADGRFDLAISHCCLQDVSDYRAALREVARVVRPHGHLVLSVVHPFTWQFEAHWRPGPPFAGFIEDPQYLTERFSGRNMFHRPASVYTRAVTDAGFALLGLLEPRPGDDLEPVLGSDPRWERWRRVPDFLFIHARRER